MGASKAEELEQLRALREASAGVAAHLEAAAASFAALNRSAEASAAALGRWGEAFTLAVAVEHEPEAGEEAALASVGAAARAPVASQPWRGSAEG